MKKLLITGSSGFIGSTLAHAALDRGFEVFAGIRQSSSRKYLQDDRIHPFIMNLSDSELLVEQFQTHQFDFIIHNAGIVKADRQEEYFRVNTGLTENIVEALHKADAIPTKFVFMSSLASYGPADLQPDDLVLDRHSPQPITTYGRSKRAAEDYLFSKPSFPYIIFRPTAVYGPKESELFTFFDLINKRIEAYIGKKPQQLTFIYIKDLVKVVLDALEAPVAQKSYFLCDGQSYSAEDLAGFAKQALQKQSLLRFKIPVSLVRFIATISEGIGKVTGKSSAFNQEKVNELSSLNWKCDIAPLKEDLQFDPQYDLQRGIQETIDWYKKERWLR